MAGLVIPTTFTAIDKMSSVFNKMNTSMGRFAQNTADGLKRVESAEKSLRGSISKGLGMIGQLGVGLGAMQIGSTVVKSQIEAEKAMASLSAITGLTGKEFQVFAGEISRVSKEQKMFSADTAKAFEIIGSAKSDLLGNAKALGIVAENAILLSKATGDDLTTSAGSLTGTLNQFNLAASESARVINALAAGSLVGAANVPLISEAMDKFGTAANAMNVSVEESVSLIEVLAEKNIMGAEAGTALRNIMIKMGTASALPREAIAQMEKFGVNIKMVADANVPLVDRLKEFSKISGDATALAKVFGNENYIAGQIILQNIGTFEKFANGVTGTNTAMEQAAINGDTMANRITELTNAFKNATTTTGSNNAVLVRFKQLLVWGAQNMDKIVSVTVVALGIFVAYKAIMFAINAVLLVYRAYVAIAAAAQWVWNIAMQANPLVLLITLVVAFVAAVVGLVYVIYRVVKAFMQWIGIFDFIKEKWAALKAAFASGDFLEALKLVGQTILKFILAPIEAVLKLMSMIPGAVGDTAASALAKLNVVTGTTVNSDATAEKVRTENYNRTEQKNSMLTINNQTGFGVSVFGNDPNIKLSPTLGWQ